MTLRQSVRELVAAYLKGRISFKVFQERFVSLTLAARLPKGRKTARVIAEIELRPAFPSYDLQRSSRYL